MVDWSITYQLLSSEARPEAVMKPLPTVCNQEVNCRSQVKERNPAYVYDALGNPDTVNNGDEKLGIEWR